MPRTTRSRVAKTTDASTSGTSTPVEVEPSQTSLSRKKRASADVSSPEQEENVRPSRPRSRQPPKRRRSTRSYSDGYSSSRERTSRRQRRRHHSPTPLTTRTYGMDYIQEIPKFQPYNHSVSDRRAVTNEFIERVSRLDEDLRLMTALDKMDLEERQLIRSLMYDPTDFQEFKQKLREQFGQKPTAEEAVNEWKSLRWNYYSETLDLFVRKLKHKYPSIQTLRQFGNDKDAVLKQKIFDASPSQILEEIRPYLSAATSLDGFCDKVREVTAKNIAEGGNVYHVRDKPPTTVSRQPEQKADPPSSTSANSSNDEMLKVMKDLCNLVKNQNSPSKHFPRQRRYYCNHCRKDGHSIDRCHFAPEHLKNLCFDCKQKGCRRGNPNCPKKPPVVTVT